MNNDSGHPKGWSVLLDCEHAPGPDNGLPEPRNWEGTIFHPRDAADERIVIESQAKRILALGTRVAELTTALREIADMTDTRMVAGEAYSVARVALTNDATARRA